MRTLKQISSETLAKANILSNQQMRKVTGGGSQQCWIRCDQDSSKGKPVSDCERATAESSCSDLSQTVCVCGSLDN